MGEAQPKPCARNAAGRGKKPSRRVSGDGVLDQVIGTEEGVKALLPSPEIVQRIIHRKAPARIAQHRPASDRDHSHYRALKRGAANGQPGFRVFALRSEAAWVEPPPSIRQRLVVRLKASPGPFFGPSASYRRSSRALKERRHLLPNRRRSDAIA